MEQVSPAPSSCEQLGNAVGPSAGWVRRTEQACWSVVSLAADSPDAQMQEKASTLHFRPQCLNATVTAASTSPQVEVLSTEADLHVGRGSCSKSTGPQLGDFSAHSPSIPMYSMWRGETYEFSVPKSSVLLDIGHLRGRVWVCLLPSWGTGSRKH